MTDRRDDPMLVTGLILYATAILALAAALAWTLIRVWS